MPRYSRRVVRDGGDGTKSIKELPARNGLLEKTNSPNDEVATKQLMTRKHHRDLYGLCYDRISPVLPTGNELNSQEPLMIEDSSSLLKDLDILSIAAKEREERINTVTRVLHLATANMTGLVANVPQRMQVSHYSRPDTASEMELLKERIKDLERCWTGLMVAVESISTTLYNFGSRLPSPYSEDSDIPDYFLRITRNSELGSRGASNTYFDDTVGFACADYKHVETENPQDLLPLSRTPYNNQSYGIQRRMFLKHMNGLPCPSSYISVEQNPYRTKNILCRYEKSDCSIAVIDTRKLRKMGVHFERSKVIQEHFGFSPKQTKGNNTHWLVEYWIPAETFNMISIETFEEVFRMFDPIYKTKIWKETFPHDVQCRYDDKEGFMIYDPTDIATRLGSMKI